jgi:hypothetical protein
MQIPSDVLHKIEEFQRFVQGRTYILSKHPQQTFVMAASHPGTSTLHTFHADCIAQMNLPQPLQRGKDGTRE